MTDYATMLQRVQAQIRQLELTEEQIFDQMQPLKIQERTLLGVLRALEEKRAEEADQNVAVTNAEGVSKINDEAITVVGDDDK
ncbi:hypothetical protein H8E77_39700 [bacterium]|nr:hypothetical protein [bacterium]